MVQPPLSTLVGTVFVALLGVFVLATPVMAGGGVQTQSETLAQRAAMSLQQGNLSLADAQARDALKQGNTVSDKARATIVLALIQAKNGQPGVAEQLLKNLIVALPETEPYRNQAIKALAAVQANVAASPHTPIKAIPAYNANAEKDYFTYAITAGEVVHWNLARMPLRVYIEPNASATQLFGNTEALILNGMNQWRKAEPRLSFSLVNQEKDADIRVRWQRTLEHNRIGESPSFMVGKRLVLADLVLATHHPTGTALTRELVNHTIIHEFGHVLGIHGHSPNESDIMYWQATKTQAGLSARDVATLKRLYATPADYTNDVTQTMEASRSQAKTVLVAQKLMEGASYTKALEQLAPLLKVTPAYYDAHLLAAVCHSRLGNTALGIQHYEKALAVDGADASARFNLGLLYIRMAESLPTTSASYLGYHQKALATFTQAKAGLSGTAAEQALTAINHCKKVISEAPRQQTATTQ